MSFPTIMKSKNKLLATIFSVIVVSCVVVPANKAAVPAVVDLTLRMGDSNVVDCIGLTRAAVGDPQVADVLPVSTKELLINAKSPGKTVVYVWDSSGRRTFNVSVIAGEIDIAKVCAAIESEIGDPRITTRAVGTTIFLEGTVSSEVESNNALAVAEAVVENAVFRGIFTTSSTRTTTATVRPIREATPLVAPEGPKPPGEAGPAETPLIPGETIVMEKSVAEREMPLVVQTGLRIPRIVNLLKIERPLDEITPATRELAAALSQAIKAPGISVRALPGNVVVVEGKVGTKADLADLDRLLKGWSTKGVSCINAVEVNSSLAHQIMVRARVVDIDKSALKDFGLDWGRVLVSTATAGAGTSQVSITEQPFFFGQAKMGPFDIMEGGKIYQFDPIGARVRALEQQNKARTLAEPNLLMLDGQEGSILVGGEIPIPVAQGVGGGGGAGGAAISVQYREFGVRLNVSPEITGEDTLQLKVVPEVSSLDFANAVTVSGFSIPALRTRRAETTVNIKNGQSLIIGGLIQNSTARLVKKIPVLSDIPILGELFKMRNFVNNESELVIIVTPQIVAPTSMTGGG